MNFEGYFEYLVHRKTLGDYFCQKIFFCGSLAARNQYNSLLVYQIKSGTKLADGGILDSNKLGRCIKLGDLADLLNMNLF